jgi:hypothetical protein
MTAQKRWERGNKVRSRERPDETWRRRWKKTTMGGTVRHRRKEERKAGEALTITMQLERDGDSERVQLGSEWMTGVAVVVQQGAPRALHCGQLGSTAVLVWIICSRGQNSIKESRREG